MVTWHSALHFHLGQEVQMTKKKGDGPPRESKYARKVRLRREQLEAEEGKPHIAAVNPSCTVHATVVATIFHKGYGFLKSTEGDDIFLGLHIVRRDYHGPRITVGDTLECEIEDAPNGKGKHVTRIISVTPTDTPTIEQKLLQVLRTFTDPLEGGEEDTVRAVVVKNALDVGFGFLQTHAGQSVFLGKHIVARDMPEEAVQLGDVLTCEVWDDPRGKGLRVRRILQKEDNLRSRL